MPSLGDLFKYLRSLWGTLASLTILFPTAAAFLKVPLISNSVLKALYSVAGTTLSALALLILLTLADSLTDAKRVRRIAIVFIASATLLFFVFVGIKTAVLYDHDTTEITTRNGIETTTERQTNSSGEVKVLTKHFDRDSRKSNEDVYIQTSPYEVLALALFSIMFVCFTVSFATLGIYYYKATHPAAQGVGRG